MRSQDLEQAHQILRTAVSAVPADAWSAASPCEEWNVAQVAQHAALDQLLYVASVTGGDKPTGDAFNPTGDMPSGAAEFVGAAIDASATAFISVDAEAETVPVPLPPYSLPPTDAAGAAALDAAIHGWDIAVATGQTADFSPGLAANLQLVAEKLVEPLRQWGAYAPAIDPEPDADDVARLLNYLGRRADWTGPVTD